MFEDTVELDLAWDTHEQLAEERREELRQQGLAVGMFPPPYVARDRVEQAAAARGLIRIGAGRDALPLGWTGVTSYAGRLDAFLREVAVSGTDTRIVASGAGFLNDGDLERVTESAPAVAAVAPASNASAATR